MFKRLLWLGLLPILLSGCASQKPADREFFAMDTLMSITAYGDAAEDALTAAIVEINRLESLLSRTREGSDVVRLNTAAPEPVTLSPETSVLLELSQLWWEKTGGAFDITVAPLVAAWGFAGGEEHRVPSQDEISELLALTGCDKLTVTETSAALGQAGMAADLGGIAKGYAADQAAACLRELGISSALLRLGGNIAALGSKPDGTPWRVGVQDPKDLSAILGVLELEDLSAVTSGDYQRYFEQDGVRYHHIIDPATGAPASSGLLSATVVCSNSALADLLSTAVFILGEQASLELWRREGGFELVLVTDDCRVLVTPGLEGRFCLEDGAEYTLEAVS